jgi:DNA helicase-2/ATP-dependent DNA helicase PcrA
MKELSKMSPYELGESGREEAIRHLILYLSKGTANEKRLAASAINKLSVSFHNSCRKAIPFLIENLGDGHPQVRQYTLKALGKFALSAQAIKVIQEVHEGDTAEYNRRIAGEILVAVNEKVYDYSVDSSAVEAINAEKELFKAYSLETKFSEAEESFINLINKECNISFTEKQKGAVLHKEGPALVLAVPGAGKTTVLLARTANLIVNHGINPANILSITFSKASAMDMRNRYNSIFSNITSIGGNFSTIHSFCYELINKFAQIHNIKYKVIEVGNTEVNKRTLLKQCYKKYNKENIDEDALDELINSIGYVKNMMYSEEEITAYSQSLDINKFSEIYGEYENIKKGNNFLDYDDMLSFAYEILNKDLALLQRYRDIYKYIQVDEAQDTSKLQHKIIQLLAQPYNNVFMVADDDQSIYGFRGAFPKFLLEIDNLYPNTKRIYIEENFRSTKEIVGLANTFIKGNEVRFNKELHTNNTFGTPVNIVKLLDEEEQLRFIVDEINNCNKSGSRAILYRNNMTSIILADELSRAGVSFYLKDYNRFFFRHFITEDIKCFLNLILDNSDIDAFSRVYYRVNSYLLKETVAIIKASWKRGKSVFDFTDTLNINENQKRNIIRLKEIFSTIKHYNPDKIVQFIEEELGYNKYLKDNARILGYSYEGLRAILINLKALASKSNSIAAFLVRIEELEKIMENSTKYNKESVITLSTMHSSKGLEFLRVYIIDLFENIIPSRGSIDKFEVGDKDAMEEERRLLYVAMTRARRELNLIFITRKNNETMTPSRFIRELREGVN